LKYAGTKSEPVFTSQTSWLALFSKRAICMTPADATPNSPNNFVTEWRVTQTGATVKLQVTE
jgi:hypothetical protein